MIRKRNLLFIPLAAVIFTACSKKDSIHIEEEPIEQETIQDVEINVKLGIDQTEGNIFAPVIFRLVDPEDPDRNSAFVAFPRNLDSLVWEIDGGAERVHLFENDPTGRRWSLILWTHHFYLPGTHQIHLNGYRDGDVIKYDSLNIEIKNEKDFLNTDWAEFEENHGSIVFNNKADSVHYFSMRKTAAGGNQAIFLNNWISKRGGILPDVESETLFAYISKLYGKPDYSNETEKDIDKIYASHFAADPKHGEPQNIWLTENTKIVLLKYFYEDIDGYRYQILAIPQG